MCACMRPSIEYIPTHRLFQRLRRDFPSIFQVRRHARCPKSATPLAQSAVCGRPYSAVLSTGTPRSQTPGCVNLARFIRPSILRALQIEQSDGQIESLALSDELDTADKRSSALAGERCWQGCCLCCMPNGLTHKLSQSLAHP